MRETKFVYKRIPRDKEGWSDASAHKPRDFDLCQLKVEGKGIVTGWACGSVWDGLHLREQDKVLYWKKKKQHVGELNAIS